jgi:hypothetical protein
MGYRGKVEEQNRARDLRAQNWLLQDIATELAVSKSSVSLWVRDVEFVPSKRRYGPRVRPNKLMQRKLDEIAHFNETGQRRVGDLTEREFLFAGAALYAGEGAKADKTVMFANSDPALIAFFTRWLRHFFEVDESRLRLRLYLHEGLDLAAAIDFWTSLTRIPASQLHKPYRAVPDPTIRKAKHVFGCAGVVYNSTSIHREVMGIVRALLSCDRLPG